MADIWTIHKLLTWITDFFTQKNVDAPRLSAEMLLSHVLGMKRIELYMHFDKPVDDAKREVLRGLVKRAGDQEPLVLQLGIRRLEIGIVVGERRVHSHSSAPFFHS